MRYWWVNQGSTHNEEHEGSYIWSPLREKDNVVNRGYESMKLVSPGDLLWSHFDGKLRAIGTATSYCYPFKRPGDFPEHQNKGNDNGWKVDVVYRHDVKAISPKENHERLKPFLPDKYSPMNVNGIASMKLYLIELSGALAAELMTMMNIAVADFPTVVDVDSRADEAAADLEKADIESISTDASIGETEKKILIDARLGQGKFRKLVAALEKKCRVSGISNTTFLTASHIKPWSDCSSKERLDPENGFLLSPNIDRLFDRNFISFDDDGKLIVSSLLTASELKQFGLTAGMSTGQLTNGQKAYLVSHRERLKG